jgi:carotenoid cleavage dioxygenase-like enzyme
MQAEDSRSLLYRDLTREHGFEPLRVEGKLPAGLDGTLYRNGPGRFDSFASRYYHLLESDGALSAVRFGAGLPAGQHRASPSSQRGPEATGRRTAGCSCWCTTSAARRATWRCSAEAPEAGPIGRAHFDHHVPVTLHGTWVCA